MVQFLYSKLQLKLISIMEEDGTQIHNRDCIVTHCVEFCQELYRSRRLQTNTIEPQQAHRPSMDDAPPVILPVYGLCGCCGSIVFVCSLLDLYSSWQNSTQCVTMQSLL